MSAGSKPDRAGLSKATDRAGNIKVIHFGDQLDDFFFFQIMLVMYLLNDHK